MPQEDQGAGNDTPGAGLPPLDRLIPRVARALSGPLPGREAQLRMAPRRRDGETLHGARIPATGAVPAAGLVLVYPREGRAHIVLTVRSPDLPLHPGQTGLPGGMQDPGETLLQTALRETREEIGVESEGLEVLGALTPLYIPPSRFLLHPYVAASRTALTFRPHVAEVARVLEIPLAAVLDPEFRVTEPRRLSSGEAVIPAFRFDGETVWGATGMVLAELAEVLERVRRG